MSKKIIIFFLAIFCFLPGVVFADPTPTSTPASPQATPSGGGSASPSTNSQNSFMVTIAPPSNIPSSFKKIETAIPKVFDAVIVISGVIFLILMLVGGIQYLISAGNEEGTKKALKLLTNAVVGLVIVLGAWAAGTWILARFGIKIT